MTSFEVAVRVLSIGTPRELNTTQAVFANVAPSQGRLASVGPPGAPLRQGGACAIAGCEAGGGAPTVPRTTGDAADPANDTLADRFIPGTTPPPGPPPGPRQPTASVTPLTSVPWSGIQQLLGLSQTSTR